MTISIYILLCFLVTSIVGPNPVFAQDFRLPAPGIMVNLSPAFNPVVLKGIKLDPKNPFRFHFFVDSGDSRLSQNELRNESSKLIKYFLASLTIPEKDLWVNLSPYEKDRIVPQEFGQTEMGRDLLAEDYILKQITASLIYPESNLGKEFWQKVYAKAQAKYGTTNIPINTFNKVWIVPEKAVVYENGGVAFVLENHLRVMLEQDYLSLAKHEGIQSKQAQIKGTNQLGSQIVREIVIPALTKEVNEGKHFSQLRQVFYSLILATWYKKKIKGSILNKIYSNQDKIGGINVPVDVKDKIYQEYLKAFKRGVYNYIKEESDSTTGQIIPRKYFSGGVTAFVDTAMTVVHKVSRVDFAALIQRRTDIDDVLGDFAMINKILNIDPGDLERQKLENYIKELGSFDRVERASAAAGIPKLNLYPEIILNSLADYLINPTLPSQTDLSLDIISFNKGRYRRNTREAVLGALKIYLDYFPKYQGILAARLSKEAHSFKADYSRVDEKMTHEARVTDTLLDNLHLFIAVDKKYPKDTPYWWSPDIRKFIYPDKGDNDTVSNILYRDFAMQSLPDVAKGMSGVFQQPVAVTLRKIESFGVYDEHDQAYHQILDAITTRKIPQRLPIILFDQHSDNEEFNEDNPIGIGNWLTALLQEKKVSDVFWIYPQGREVANRPVGISFKDTGNHLEKILVDHQRRLQNGVILSFDMDYFASTSRNQPASLPLQGEIRSRVQEIFALFKKYSIPIYLVNGAYSAPIFAPSFYKLEFDEALRHAAQNYVVEIDMGENALTRELSELEKLRAVVVETIMNASTHDLCFDYAARITFRLRSQGEEAVVYKDNDSHYYVVTRVDGKAYVVDAFPKGAKEGVREVFARFGTGGNPRGSYLEKLVGGYIVAPWHQVNYFYHGLPISEYEFGIHKGHLENNDLGISGSFAYFSKYLPGQPLMSYHPCC